MMDVSNYAPTDQQVNVNAAPEKAAPDANSLEFQPSPARVVGDLGVSPTMGQAEQFIDVTGSGDLAAGEFEPQVGSRTPNIKGLP